MAARYPRLSAKLNKLLPHELLDSTARAVGFIRRLRQLEAWAFVFSVVLSRFCSGTPGFEDARRQYQKLTGKSIEARPFHLRFKQEKARQLMERAFDTATAGWRSARRSGHPLFRFFPDLVACDSSLVHLPDGLRKFFQGLRKVKAQLKVFLIISVVSRVPLHAELMPARHSDQKYPLPLDRFRPGTLWLFDKGFVAYERLCSLAAESHYFLCPMAQHPNPFILSVISGPNELRKKVRRSRGEVRLRSVLPRGKTIGRRFDLEVLLQDKGPAAQMPVRLVILPGPKGTQRPFLTNLRGQPWQPNVLGELYRLRWQIELVFRELKQELQLEAIPTKDPVAATVFVWASLLALALSRAVGTWLAPLERLVGLASELRLSLVTRALKSSLSSLVTAIGGLRRVRNLVGQLADTIEQEARNPSRDREDSLARLSAYLEPTCAAV